MEVIAYVQAGHPVSHNDTLLFLPKLKVIIFFLFFHKAGYCILIGSMKFI